MGGGDSPQVPNTGKAYEQGIQVMLKYLPTLLQAEQTSREQYDPARVVEQQQLQQTYGPTQYGQMLDAFNQLDPG